MNRPRDHASAAGLLPRMEARRNTPNWSVPVPEGWEPDSSWFRPADYVHPLRRYRLQQESLAHAALQAAQAQADALQLARPVILRGGSAPARVLHYSGMMRALKLRRLPAWADQSAILAVYENACVITRATGIPHHVDHVLPLQGDKVSGLHVAENLQAIPAADNLRKQNRFEPC